ncbi:uncharacterized protein LOC119636216 isoform X2 [Glossina fuscipes]|uniref:Uncharacterized protein LOC119636216 isoform X2 n=1 Tax=Glossina fuscipes TaxID=7396 RepID=A0A9C5YX90_9MUSC|nr:uncharacterized protein LOC119636216 isoform X2 [Glossina fuscipes]
MFGAKLRTWMENHIVRPRKKGNKNKSNSSSASNTITQTTDNNHHLNHSTAEIYSKQKHAASGFTMYQHHSNGAGSPFKTNSNSNSSSANHTGCSSVISSPVRRREVSPIQNHAQSRYGWQSPDREYIISPKSDHFLYPSQHSSQQYLQSNTNTNTNSQDISGEDNKYKTTQPQQEQQQQPTQQHQLNCSTSSFSSLSWSTGSKEPSMNSSGVQQVKTSGVTQVVEINNGLEHQVFTPEEQRNSDEDPNAVHYEEIGTLIRHPENLFHGTTLPPERPKSEQFSCSTHTGRILIEERHSQDDHSARYGRLLPSKMPNPIIVSFRSGSEECIPRQGAHGPLQTSGAHSYTGSDHGGTFMHIRNIQRSKHLPPIYGGQALSENRPPGAPLISLSSPESAYSTGYSTDGTSPGNGYTPPEYYINMRTGTHYFPKSINSLAIEAQRYKFGLNKIEEMSPIDPLPKTSFNHRSNIDECDGGQMKMPSFPIVPPWGSGPPSSPLPMHAPIVIPTLKGFESPSPRQRCRIRTNPWYSTTETSSSSSTATHSQPGVMLTASQISSMTISSNSSQSTQSAPSTIHVENNNKRDKSPGVKSMSTSSSAGGCSSGLSIKHNMTYVSSESSSSLTEVENVHRSFTSNTMRRKRSLQLQQHCIEPVADSPHKQNYHELPLAAMSDDDATLNEMMGKFDESYVYEKETDILSDSDPTDCPSDLDTGQDAGDECDTDELLDIDFIDTSSMQEVYERKDALSNMGYYVQGSPLLNQFQQHKAATRIPRNSRSLKISAEQNLLVSAGGSAQRRRKRYHKTRKKSSESRDHGHRSPMRKPRETRSVGGTPVCLRKHINASDKERYSRTTPSQLSQRSNSLTDAREKRFMTVGESEKALLRADFEADVKYRQLIMEAELILVSMRNSAQSIPRETPVASPRRVNPLANKRVEMIKNCEIEPKRDFSKQQSQQQQQQQQQQQLTNKLRSSSELSEQELTAAVNKRIELLKYESNSPPNSPKLVPCSPRKTHLTNFINQNLTNDLINRKSYENSPLTPRRAMQSPACSPRQQRRLKTQSPVLKTITHSNNQILYNLSDSDQELCAILNQKDERNQNFLKEKANIIAALEDVKNQNFLDSQQKVKSYCPQSEPLKRKVYKGATAYEQLKNDYESESVSIFQHRHQLKSFNSGSSDFQKDRLKPQNLRDDFNHLSKMQNEQNDQLSLNKTALIVSTIEDLKRNLEHQSLELNGLNET